MFKQVINRIKKYYVRICQSPQKSFGPGRKPLPKYPGVYIIYYRRKPLYVGRSNNIRQRFVAQHLSSKNVIASSSFRKHLLSGEWITKLEDARDWIINNCRIKYIEIDNYDDSILLEAMLIKLWRKKYKLLNDNKYEV